MSEDLVIEGWIAGRIGLAMAMVGLAPLPSEPRYPSGWPYLPSGFQGVPVLMGAFAVPQIMAGRHHVETDQVVALTGRILPKGWTIRRRMPTIARSGVIGTGVGALPGVGEDAAGWVSLDPGPWRAEARPRTGCAGRLAVRP